MHSAIVLDEAGTQTAVVDTVEMLNDVKTFADIIVVSTRPAPAGFSTGLWVTGENMVEAFSNATSMAASKRILVVSSALVFNFTDLSKLVAEIDNKGMLEHVIVVPRAHGEMVDMPDIRPETIVQSLNRCDVWPLMCVSTSRYALNAVTPGSTKSVTESLAQALIRSITDGDNVKLSTSITPLVNAALMESTCTLTPDAKARCLKVAVDGMNIEELFPNHNWGTYSEESAAASYHELAALFLRFQDADSAAECLDCSEKLEESPRYFALQGMIQQANGETLGAVANLVSSLQCYESRKTNDGKHYLTFTPTNIETVQSRLAEGLEALNQRDNERALASFSDAVFTFDSFYSEVGLPNPAKSES
jgi:hypothetical protein